MHCQSFVKIQDLIGYVSEYMLIVDLYLRTKADLYSFMQCSFVKIQDLIGYVSEYMLMRPKAT
jgi:hypothetical protein